MKTFNFHQNLQQKYGYLYEILNVKSEKQSMIDFYKNLMEIHHHNMNESKTYEQGLNQDSFLTFEERKKYRMGVKYPRKITKRKTTEGFPKSYKEMLKNFKAPDKG